MGEPSPVLNLIAVAKQYAATDGGGPPVTVLQDVSLSMLAGESRAIVGPSGSGKSTLLNIMGTLDRPSRGQVLLEGEDVSRLDDLQLAAVRNRQIGFVFQAHHLLPQLTVLENVLVPTIPIKEPALRSGADARARMLLNRVGLSARLTHRPGQLSGGERQRVAVVRALINQPRLLLADEPTGALDRQSAQELGQLLLDLNREQGVTLVVVTHALDLATRLGSVSELRDGTLRPFSEKSP